MLKTGIMMVQLDVWLEIQYKTSRFAGFHTIRTRNKWNDAHYDHSKNGTIIDREETNTTRTAQTPLTKKVPASISFYSRSLIVKRVY